MAPVGKDSVWAWLLNSDVVPLHGVIPLFMGSPFSDCLGCFLGAIHCTQSAGFPRYDAGPSLEQSDILTRLGFGKLGGKIRISEPGVRA
jgi:hypothetical protein